MDHNVETYLHAGDSYSWDFNKWTENFRASLFFWELYTGRRVAGICGSGPVPGQSPNEEDKQMQDIK